MVAADFLMCPRKDFASYFLNFKMMDILLQEKLLNRNAAAFNLLSMFQGCLVENCPYSLHRGVFVSLSLNSIQSGYFIH